MLRYIDKQSKYIGYVFYILNLASFISMFSSKIRPGVLGSMLMAIILLWYSKYIHGMFKNINILCILYLIICVLSGVSYLTNIKGNPILFFYGLSFNLFPIVMYLVGFVYAHKKDESIFFHLVISNFIIIALGIILHYTEPPFYAKVYKYSSSSVTVGGYYRFPSYMSSMAVGNITAISIPILFMIKEKFNYIFFYLAMIIFVIGSIISMQRSSYLSILFGLLTSVIVIIKKQKSEHAFLKTILGLLFTLLLLYFFFNNIMTYTQKIVFYNRLGMFNTAISGRINQWLVALEIATTHPLLGSGLGSAGHKAASMGIQEVVPDGNYFRILAEVGVTGFLVFLLLNGFALLRALKNNNFIMIALLIYLFQAIGTNVFDIYYISFIYWFIVGYAANCSNTTIKDLVNSKHRINKLESGIMS